LSIALPFQGTNTDLDSDFDAITGMTLPQLVTAGQVLTHIDGGLQATQTGIIGDFVWLDTNCDGMQGPLEPGIAQVQVQLFNISQPAAPVQVITTGAFGQFHFLAPPGTYFLRVLPGQTLIPTSSLQGIDPQLDSDLNPLTGETAPFTLQAGSSVTSMDAGFCMCGGTVAGSQSIGAGCGVPTVPALATSPPVLGGPQLIRQDTTYSQQAFTFFASVAPVTNWVHAPSGCAIYVDLFQPSNLMTLMSGALDQNGEASLVLLLPSEPTLAGFPVILQAAVFAPQGPPSGLHLSNGVLLTVGCP
jgi:hypothetical protein